MVDVKKIEIPVGDKVVPLKQGSMPNQRVVR